MVRKSHLDELQWALVFTVIVGMVLEFLKTEVVSMHSSDFCRLDADKGPWVSMSNLAMSSPGPGCEQG